MSDDVLTFEELMRRKRGETAPVEVVTEELAPVPTPEADEAVLTSGSDEGTTPPADPEAA